jgi:hypothetical protein
VDDLRNQARNNLGTVGIVVICVLLLVAFIAFVLATGPGRSKSDGGVAHGGETHVGMVLAAVSTGRERQRRRRLSHKRAGEPVQSFLHFTNRRIAMLTTEEMIEEELPGSQKVPEVEVQGDAVIRLNTPGGVEERKVRLPKTTWG